MSFDEVLDRIGGFGRFQKTLYVWICLPQIFLAFHMLVSVFTGAVPPHLCRSSQPVGDPRLLGLNNSNASWETCSSLQNVQLYQLNHSDLSLPISEHSTTSKSCKGGWEFSKDVFLSTVVTEVSVYLETLRHVVCYIAYMFVIVQNQQSLNVICDMHYNCQFIDFCNGFQFFFSGLPFWSSL